MTGTGTALIWVGLGVGLTALVVLHLLPTGLSPVRNAVSQYGITRFSLGYRVQTLGYGVAGSGAALGVASRTRASTAVVAPCLVFAASRAAISWFPMDAPGTERTDTGRRHGLLAMCAFVSLGVAASSLSRTLSGQHGDGSFASASSALGTVMLVTLVVMLVDRLVGGRHFGLVERIFYASMTAWLVVVAVLVAAG